ncbi:hypothetical protein SAMN02949497_0539 [Methylomagnum ishizawai]|uniref:Uncharacterized protein n=1 Tax=Methylomagnum ishizawai TaxID=1760988 RepID=A0A1Y6D9E5_9GAMM|nr:hypothetical protein [Methylomagnum ishizawai]SMF97323.1 hypothetical protein SAMN02949497_0343 [Methylomagnum ishizawai]SMF97509.1 hypothetical protein SAMN02949497_0539 [Methylomagnum ishizawai]
MKPIEINSVVKSVTFLTAQPDGTYQTERLTETGPRKKQAKALRPLERVVRKLVKSELAAAKVYLERHDRSNQRKSNGWLKDLGKNLGKAVKSAKDSAKQPKLTIVR